MTRTEPMLDRRKVRANAKPMAPHVLAMLIVLGTSLGADSGSALAQADHTRYAAGRAVPGTPNWTGVSEKTLREIEAVQAAVAHLATPEAAREAGFRPALGLIPTMGVHWVNPARVRDGTPFDPAKPDHLLFAPVNGTDMLVGIAFAYRGPPGEATPDGFDGDLDVWHDHPQLAPAGQTLTMLHVWFVPSPDGPFAGHNPWLPYWAAGLEPPDESTLKDAEQSKRARTLALALAETVGETNLVRISRRFAGEAFNASVGPRRNAIRSLVPALDAAARAGNWAEWNRIADQAIAEWETIRQAYLDAAPNPLARQRLAEFFDEMITGHPRAGHERHVR